MLGAAGAFGGMLFNLVVGSLITHQGYGAAFVIVALLHPVSFVILLLALRRIERLI